MRGLRRTTRGIIKLVHNEARLDDLVTNKRRYFRTEKQASAFADKLVAKAKAAGEQHQDRFYIWHCGVCYSCGN